MAEKTILTTLVHDTNAAGDDLERKKENYIEEIIRFEKPQLARHLKPLYIKAYIDGRPINLVLIDGGAIMNVMSVGILRKLGKNQRDLKETNMKITNFIGESIDALGFYITKLIMGTKTSSIVLFIVDIKLGYSLLLGRD